MGRLIRATKAIAVCASVVVCATAAWGQGSGKAPPSNPVGANWNTKIEPNAATNGVTLDARQTEIVKLVSDYFGALSNMQGAFRQTAADGKQMRGKFFLKRPGRFRFDYALPSRQVIISDGNLLAIQDHDLKTEDVVELDQTPFKILLRAEVDLLRDAHIVAVDEVADMVIVTLQDKNPESYGRIKLFLSKTPELELKEWVTTDAQGLDTRVEIGDLDTTQDIDAAKFRRDLMIKF